MQTARVRWSACFFAAVVMVSVCLCSAAEAGIGFRYERSFDLPALDKPLTSMTFVRISGEKSPVLLATDGQGVVLYSPDNDTLQMRQTVATPGEECRYLLAGRFNRDTIPDIVIGLVSAHKFRIVLLDGKSRFKKSFEKSFPLGEGGYCDGAISYLTAIDLNNDSFSELLISADTGLARVRQAGMTQLYASFPDSVLWTINRTVRYAQAVTLVDKSRVLYAEPSPCERIPYRMTRQYNSTAQAISIDRNGAVGTFGLVYPNPCGGLPPNFHSVVPSMKVYLYDPELMAQSTLITEAVREFHCGDDTTTQKRVTLTSSLMHSVQTLEHLWSWDLPYSLHDCTLIPGLDDYFFGFDSSGLAMYRFSDGSVATHLSQVPEGKIGWVSSGGDNIPRLLTVSGRRATLHTLDLTTDSAEDGENGLPVTFTFLPFYRDQNGGEMVIPVDIPRTGGMRVQVVDRSGTVVANLASGQFYQVQTSFKWQTTGIASGIYTVRATFDKTTISRDVLVVR